MTTESLAKEWLRLDRDPVTRNEIQNFLDEENWGALNDRLRQRLAFGTAGLRARMGAGFSRINCVTIIQTSQGLAEWLLSTNDRAKEAGIVIGFDGRHNSRRFAELSVAVFVSKGIKIWWFEDVVHTPLVPFAVKHLKAAGGVMITASHNPAQDNGYKVYGRSGCQINAPADSEITSFILKNLEPRIWDTAFIESSPLKKNIKDPMALLYSGYLWDLTKLDNTSTCEKLPTFVYTPMHGVGLSFMQKAVKGLQIPVEGAEDQNIRMIVVPEQGEPHPDFPTVKYPNPEEDGSMDLAIATAERHNVSLIIANDPDADRLAIAEKVDGVWKQFTGDQVGVLLAHYMISQLVSSNTADDPTNLEKTYVLTSAVSSHMLARIAAKAGIGFEETLTGFKWLGKRALEIESQGGNCLFAYEEALGYMIPSIVYDKDGVLAAAVFLSACTQWGSLWARLQSLYQIYGYFVTKNTYWKSPTIEKTVQVFESIRRIADPYPTNVAGRHVSRWRDLTKAFDSSKDQSIPDLPTSQDTQMITCWLDGSEDDDGIRFTIRASGTEPKIKVYLECAAKRYEDAETGASTTLKYIAHEWLNDPQLQVEPKFQAMLDR